MNNSKKFIREANELAWINILFKNGELNPGQHKNLRALALYSSLLAMAEEMDTRIVNVMGRLAMNADGEIAIHCEPGHFYSADFCIAINSANPRTENESAPALLLEGQSSRCWIHYLEAEIMVISRFQALNFKRANEIREEYLASNGDLRLEEMVGKLMSECGRLFRNPKKAMNFITGQNQDNYIDSIATLP